MLTKTTEIGNLSATVVTIIEWSLFWCLGLSANVWLAVLHCAILAWPFQMQACDRRTLVHRARQKLFRQLPLKLISISG